MRETIGSGSTAKVLDFIYDESGRAFALRYSTNGGSSFTTYYYVLNLQGDVVKLIRPNASGTSYTTYAAYTYDAWGNILTQSGTMADINPLRYRGYYYDTETGFYYLQSRYYDPATHRFLNADGYASTGQGFIGTNMFAYCLNNPVNYSDEAGQSAAAVVLTGGALEAFMTWLSAVASTNWWNPVGWAAAAVTATGVICVAAYFLYEWFVDDNPQYAQSNDEQEEKIEPAVKSCGTSPASPPPNNNRNNNYHGKTLYNKNGIRIDYEYYGNGEGNVHLHYKGAKYTFNASKGAFVNESGSFASKSIQLLLEKKPIWKAIEKGIEIIGSLGGIQ